jgi:hypothetical protein
MAAMNEKYPGLADEMFPDKLSETVRSIVEASVNIFEDASALDAQVEERQCAAAAALDTDLDPSVVKALLRLKRDMNSLWTLLEDITYLESLRTCVEQVKLYLLCYIH